jgi:putative FmdB family regulatory protein
MPVYDYLCGRCGPFTKMRPMADCERPQPCPQCRQRAPRAFLTAPYCAAMPSELRLAHATNERSAASPRTRSELNNAHSAGCGCCAGKRLGTATRTRSGAKVFPSKRPWMISH